MQTCPHCDKTMKSGLAMHIRHKHKTKPEATPKPDQAVYRHKPGGAWG